MPLATCVRTPFVRMKTSAHIYCLLHSHHCKTVVSLFSKHRIKLFQNNENILLFYELFYKNTYPGTATSTKVRGFVATGVSKLSESESLETYGKHISKGCTLPTTRNPGPNPSLVISINHKHKHGLWQEYILHCYFDKITLNCLLYSTKTSVMWKLSNLDINQYL